MYKLKLRTVPVVSVVFLMSAACSDDGSDPGTGVFMPPVISGDASDLMDGNLSGSTTPDSGASLSGGDAGTSNSMDGGDADGQVALSDAGQVVPSDASSADGSADPGSVDTALCHFTPKQVLVIGDSYLRIPGNLTSVIEAHAIKAGAMPSGSKYRDVALSGAQMVSGALSLIKNIPNQYRDEQARNPDTKLVIMTGGGNDVLIGNSSCTGMTSVTGISTSCQKTVSDALAAYETLTAKMGADGVEATVLFYYPHLPGGGLGGSSPNVILDYAYPKIKDLCDKLQKPRCFFVDTRQAFDSMGAPPAGDGSGKPKAGLIGGDGVHPTTTGATLIGDLIWDTMEHNCVGSK